MKRITYIYVYILVIYYLCNLYQFDLILLFEISRIQTEFKKVQFILYLM